MCLCLYIGMHVDVPLSPQFDVHMNHRPLISTSFYHSISVFFFETNEKMCTILRFFRRESQCHEAKKKHRQQKNEMSKMKNVFMNRNVHIEERTMEWKRRERAKTTNNKVEKSMWIDIKPKKLFTCIPNFSTLHLNNNDIKWRKQNSMEL